MKARHVANGLVERLLPARLEEVQTTRAMAQLARAKAAVPFYADHLADVDLSAITTLADFRERVPFTDKVTLLDGLPEAFDQDDGTDVRAIHLTSGTSGIGQETHQRNDADVEAVGVGLAYQMLWAGLRPGHRLGLTIPYGTTMAGPFGLKGCEIAGAIPMYLGGLSADEKLARVATYRLNGLWCTPAYLRRLASVARTNGVRPATDLDSLRAIIISGESYLHSWAEEMEDFWGVRLFEMYGLTQSTGAIFATCGAGVTPDHAGQWGSLHALSHRCLVEFLRPGTNEPCEPGEVGEIVVTELHQTWFPSIRFRTGDSAVYLGEGTCSCGRSGAVMRCGSIARLDDRLKIRATNVWPEAFDAILLGEAGAEEYQGRVYVDDQGRETVAIQVEWPPDQQGTDAHPDLARLEARVLEVTGVRVSIERAVPGSLPRFDFKVRRWTDERVERNVIRHIEPGGAS